MDMTGVKGGKDWGVNEAGMKQLDDNIGVVYAKLAAMGQMDNTIIVFTTDNGAETMSFPDGGITPFKGQKGNSWEGGYRAPMLIRWPGHIKAGVTTSEMMSALDWISDADRAGRRADRRRAEEADRSGHVPRLRQDDARRGQPGRVPNG